MKSEKYKLLHNPRCSKSRQGLEFLKSKNIDFEIVLFLKEKLEIHEIKNIVVKSELNPIDLIRKHEGIWKELYKDKTLTKDQIVQAIFDHPKIMQRPIFISETKAIIAIPAEEALKIL